MTQCWHQVSGAVELYFYGELPEPDRQAMAEHVRRCADCARTLEELKVIRAALASRPRVSSPQGGDWSRFMARLDDALQSPDVRKGNPTVGRSRVQRSFKTLVSIAAVLALATIGVWLAVRPQTMPSSPADNAARTIASDALPTGDTAAPSNSASDPGVALTQLSEQHFDRSKLVVLSLANKDPQDSGDIDWDYERQLAASLLGDTRVYRQAAEERGMSNLADVMRDLELVLLQTSMSESPDAESLAQLQRLIRRRDLITKMDVVKTSGLLP